MVDTSSAGIGVCYLEQLRIVDNAIATAVSLEEMPSVISLINAIEIRLTSAEISSIETTLKVSNGDAEGERIVSGFVHALSMAHNRAKVKGVVDTSLGVTARGRHQVHLQERR